MTGIVAAVSTAGEGGRLAPFGALTVLDDLPARRIVDRHPIAPTRGELDLLGGNGEAPAVVQVERSGGAILELQRDTVGVVISRKGKHSRDIAHQLLRQADAVNCEV